MAVAFTYAAKDPALNTIPTTFPAGAVVDIYGGTVPGGPTAVATGATLLCSVTLPASPWNNSSSGSGVTLAGTWTGTGTAGASTGTTATFFRLRTSADSPSSAASTTAARIQGTAGASGTDMVLNNASIATGQTVTITAATFT